ncbi:hypothetical protein WOLCODRAFT_137803 [Wolfiporia cocos MD-104 SS10]|uniref:Uncharacterized protein n=1 Tax=Wolfiporia cocos (strain MD-104) TaxID=742152 RepID=A0A2H3JQU1_WOLCO|nr:hypothetical protein WOLCODRAFT_137803 [Wolfiporia cocos MD-104 SS10]
MTQGPSVVDTYPPELLSLICSYIYAAGLPPATGSLDPSLHNEGGVPTSLPSSYPPPQWPESTSRRTLANACLVNRAWNAAAKQWLWRKLEVCLPRSWLSLVEEIAGGDEEYVDAEQTAFIVDQTIQVARSATLSVNDLICQLSGQTAVLDLHGKVIERLSGPDGSIPPELLTPVASRDPSPRRLRQKSKSPTRYKLMRSISDAVRNVIENDIPGLYVPAPEIPHVGRLVHHLDFSHFRTIGMRRSVEEGLNNRFVTSGRLESVLKEMPSLSTFGATEYMDSALTLSILNELLLRGLASRGRGRPSRGRDLVIFDPNDTEQEDRERRREYRELEAIDLTGCVSGVFVNALTQFVNDNLISPAETDPELSEDEERQERARPISRNAIFEPLTFPGLQRLCLRGVKSVQPRVLNPFVLAFPSLTHLDLSCTRVSPDLLDALGASTTVRLRSLALERCIGLTSESIRDFLVHAPSARGIQELSLYGDGTFPSPLSEEDLCDIFTHAPCFKSGELVYLDLSSAPVTRSLLLDVCAPQPRLRSLGLSHIRELELTAIATFLKTKAPNIEVLTMAGTAPELGYGAQPVALRQVPLSLHAHIIQPLCTKPFSFSAAFRRGAAEAQPPTRLRVIELAMPLLASLGGGGGSWRVVKSKGGRGWYVDVASGWIAEAGRAVLRRDLQGGHPWRAALERLADANGNVSSGVGWHARKMEVLHGHGLLGREAGLYGAVSFAYQG